jgi:hypothetical protein
MWSALANVIAVLHAVWLAALLAGPAFARRRRRWRLIHLVQLWLTALGWTFYCPLTVIEDLLRLRADPNFPHAGSFLTHYLQRFLDLNVNWTLVSLSVWGWAAAWTAVYAAWWVRESGKKGSAI